MLVFTKATIAAHGQSDLFPQTVQVKGHVRGNVFIRPSMATRRKHIEEAPHQPEPPKPPPVTASLSPDLNSADPDEIRKWLLAIKPDKADVINDLSVARTKDGAKWHVSGHKSAMGYPQATHVLIRKGVPKRTRA